MNRKPPNAGKGRPKGVPNKVTREIKALAQNVLSRAEYLASLQERIDNGRAPHMETLLHHYAYGKPKEVVAVESEVPPFVIKVQADGEAE